MNEATYAGGALASLRIANFRVLLGGTMLGNAAQWIQLVTLGWLVYDFTGSGTALGGVNLASSAAALGATPFAGVAIDRLGRRRLMIAVSLFFAAVAGVVGLLLVGGHRAVWLLFAYAFLGGIALAIDHPLRQTVLFDLVPRRLAPNAVALTWTGWSVMGAIGPGIGGFVLLWFGAGGNFLLMSAAWVLIALSVLLIRFPPRRAAVREPYLRQLRESIVYVVREPETRVFMLMGLLMSVLVFPHYVTLPPIFAKSVFGSGPETLGILISSIGIGGIAGGVFAASLGRYERRGLVLLGAFVCESVSLALYASSPSLGFALPLFLAAGAFEQVMITTNQTLLLLSIPDRMRGRVTSLTSLNMAAMPIGAFIAGTGADLIGPRGISMVMAGMVLVIAALVFLISPTVRDYRLSRAIARAHGQEAPAGSALVAEGAETRG